MADQQHTVTGGDTKQRDETNNGGNTDLARGEPEDKDTTDQCQRQIHHHDGALAGILELMIEQHEDHQQRHERGDQQRPAGRLLALELAAIFDMIALGQFDCLLDGLLDIVHHATQVTVGHVGAHHHLALYLLAVDRVRSHDGAHLGHLAQRHLLPVGVDHQVSDRLTIGPALVGSLDSQVEGAVSVIDLADDLATQHDIHIFLEFRQWDAIFRQQLPFGNDG